jgi:hypothetical protein
METEFAAMPLSNATCLCIGSITASEADSLRSDGVVDNGFGSYLYLANAAEPKAPIEILGKFFSSFEASRLARLMGVQEALA